MAAENDQQMDIDDAQAGSGTTKEKKRFEVQSLGRWMPEDFHEA